MIVKSLEYNFPDIVHSLDVWHKSKSIKKCLLQITDTLTQGD